MTITIGVLALQGAFVEHIALLRQAAHTLRRERLRDAELSAHTSATSLGPSDPSLRQEHATNSGAASGGAADALNNITPPEDKADTSHSPPSPASVPEAELGFDFIQVRTPDELDRCAALILPGGESTAISLIAERTGLLEPLRDFVKVRRKPVWGTCAGLILLAEEANRSKDTGQELIGGLDVRVQRNYFGRQVESFEAELPLPFLDEGEGEGRFHSVFIRAPVVERVLPPNAAAASAALQTTTSGTVTAPPRQETKAAVEVLGRLPGRAKALKDQTTTAEQLGEEGDIVAVRQGNVFGTAFHPELTGDGRIHAWWLREVVRAMADDVKGA